MLAAVTRYAAHVAGSASLAWEHAAALVESSLALLALDRAATMLEGRTELPAVAVLIRHLRLVGRYGCFQTDHRLIIKDLFFVSGLGLGL